MVRKIIERIVKEEEEEEEDVSSISASVIHAGNIRAPVRAYGSGWIRVWKRARRAKTSSGRRQLRR